jgi:hypothetical protein
MSQSTLEKRLASIEDKLDKGLASMERQLLHLKAAVEKATQKDWRRSIGVLAGNEGLREVFEEAQKIREADREKARKAVSRPNQRPKQ